MSSVIPPALCSRGKSNRNKAMTVLAALVAVINSAGVGAESPDADKSAWQLSIVQAPTPQEPTAIMLPQLGKTLPVKAANWVKAGEQIWLHNVTEPSITPYLSQSKGPSPAVLLIPGGGFKFVSMSNEGWLLAEKFANAGISTFILKYRVDPTPETPAAFQASLLDAMTQPRIGRGPELYQLDSVVRARLDAATALQYLHDHQQELNIDITRLGVLGFSAGAITAMAVALEDVDVNQPAFVGAIYGSMTAVTPPADPPPLFVAMASDDPLFEHEGFGLIESWHAAGGSTELHWYANGGHGFGARTQHTTSDRWLGQFLAWLESRGILVGNANQ